MASTSLFSRPRLARAGLRPRCLQPPAVLSTILRRDFSKPGRIPRSPKMRKKHQDAAWEWQQKSNEIDLGVRKHVWDELEERGFIKQTVGQPEVIRKIMMERQIGAYVGIDPTAPSLHLGHLVVLMPIYWLYMHGFGAFTLIGHSTAKIGDPTGKDHGRPQIPPAQLVQNMTNIHHQLSALWDNVDRIARQHEFKRQWSWKRGLINNNAWWNKLPMLDVLRRLGSRVRMGPLLSRDNVKTRLEKGSGMSFSEFAYPLMQGWDWWELYKQRGVQMQIGGSDQYSNIVIGSQCVKHCLETQSDSPRVPDAPLVGFTVPLLTTSSGAKFGKSEGNALWLDPFHTSPYDLYGYLVRRADHEVEQLLKLLTFLPQDKIAETLEEHRDDPPRRVAQHLLAFEVLSFVHGETVARDTQIEHRQIYGYQTPLEKALPPDQQTQVQTRVNMQLPRSLLQSTFPRIVAAAEFGQSIGEADRLIKAGGMYIGGSPGQHVTIQKGMASTGQLHFTPLKTWNPEFIDRFLVEGRLLLLRRGKHNIRCIEFIDDAEYEKSGLTYRGQKGVGRSRRALKILRELGASLDSPEDTWDLPERNALKSRLNNLIDAYGSNPDLTVPADFVTEMPEASDVVKKQELDKRLRVLERRLPKANSEEDKEFPEQISEKE